MAEVNYGRIALIPRGDFAGDRQYEVGDVVSYEGSSYVAKARPPVATLPTDTEYWQISAYGSRYIYVNLTTDEYNQRLSEYQKDPEYIDPDTGTLFSETLYNVTDDYEKLARKAEGVGYDDTYSLGALNVQAVIDIIAAKVKNELLGKTDVVNNIVSTVANLPLSANMGNFLYERDLKTEINRVAGTTPEQLRDIYDNFSSSMRDGTWYRGIVWNNSYDYELGGGTYYLEGHRHTSLYEWQRATVYGETAKMFQRSKNNGTWTNWEKFALYDEMMALKMGIVTGKTEADINSIYNTFSSSMQNNTWYRGLISHGVAHSILGAGTLYLEGYKELSSHEWQKATSYFGNCRQFVSAKDANVWGDWRRAF